MINNAIFFRVDSSFKIATGHVMRCLTLAKALKKQNPEVEIIFICRNLEGNIIDMVKKEGFLVEILPKSDTNFLNSEKDQYLQWLEVNLLEDAKQTKEILQKYPQNSIIIIDHYAINYQWEEEIKNFVKKIVVIDDLANRKHDCDILIDQNLYRNYQSRYDGLVPEKCQKFLGPQYAMLREQFFQTKPRKRDKLHNILIFFGGIDSDNITLKAVEALIKAKKDLNHNFNVMIIGAKNDHQKEIELVCKENNFEYKSYVDNMAQIMDWADLSIGGGGTTSLERIYLKLPAIVVSLADNQVEICEALENEGLANYLGDSMSIKSDDIAFQIKESYNSFNYSFLDNKNKLNKIIDSILYEN